MKRIIDNIDEKTKKIIIIFLGIFGFVILLIIIASLINKFKTSFLNYSQLEDKITLAAKKYFNDNKDLLPTKDNDYSEVDINTLVNDKYIKKISSYLKDRNAICSATSYVVKSDNLYSYSTFLDCGDKYSTKRFSDTLKEKVVSSGIGLYKMNQYNALGRLKNVYVFRGDDVNNYINFDNKIWRIVKIDSNDNIMLISDERKTSGIVQTVWDNRYNIDKNGQYGINDYEVSIIKNELKTFYDSEIFLSDEAKSKIVSADICSGERSLDDITKDGSSECKKIVKNQKIYLLTTYDYLNASLDNNCKTIASRSCYNYNYLSNHDRNYWLLNTVAGVTYKGYKAESYVSETNLSSSGEARIVFLINSNTVYVRGDGSKTNPFIIK